MYLSLIILPLLGSIVSGFFGRKVGVKGAQLITCSCVIITTVLSILCFIEVGLNNIPVTINLFRWIDSEWFNIIWGFQYDSLTVSMLIPVLIISSLVHIYSISYMSSDPHNQRFFSYLSLFTFMMIILVTANNYLLMFVGWEGVGVCSYLLVSFWFTRIAANQSSVSAFLTNRVGDCFLTIGMFAILWSLGNLDYSTVFSLAPYINSNVVIIIGICLLIGAMAKSSQVGLHIWLPMAMEGPTPVSALIHAATMVTAGVYLLMRSSPLIEYSSTVLLLCLWLGAITTVFSSLIGLFQQDIKKIIAYSTMSKNKKSKARTVYLFNILVYQTICVEGIILPLNNYSSNSQITKASDYLQQLRICCCNNHGNFRFFNSSIIKWLHLCISIMYGLIRWKFEINKLVGISETIRLMLIYFELKLIILMSKLFINDTHAPALQEQLSFNINKPLFQSSFLKKKYFFLVFSRNMSTKITTDSLDEEYYDDDDDDEDEDFVKRPVEFVKRSEPIDKKDLAFREWLAGLIDGDGRFTINKQGLNPRFQITMDARDENVLRLLQSRYRGIVRKISNGYSVKYKLINRKGIMALLEDINGLIRNPARLLQMSKLCRRFGMELKDYKKKINFDNGWFSGFLDSDGSIHYKESTGQVLISVTQKNKYLLDLLANTYGGKVDVCHSRKDEFQYSIYKKKELYRLIDQYFNKYPLKTIKMKRINLIKKYYWVKLTDKNKEYSPENINEWAKFKDKWDNFKD